MTILEMADALRAKKVSSLELVNDTLAKIARENPRLLRTCQRCDGRTARGTAPGAGQRPVSQPREGGCAPARPAQTLDQHRAWRNQQAKNRRDRGHDRSRSRSQITNESAMRTGRAVGPAGSHC